MSLEQQIAAWPENMHQALSQLAEARARYALTTNELEVLRAKLDTPTDGETTEEDEYTELRFSYRASEETERRFEEANRRVDEARLRVEQAKARADVEIRQQAVESRQRLTEAAVAAQIKVHSEVVAAEEAHIQARSEYMQTHLARDLERDERLREHGMSQTSAPNGSKEEITRRVFELVRQQSEAYGEIERAKAGVKYQQAVGQSLKLLAQLKRAEVRV